MSFDIPLNPRIGRVHEYKVEDSSASDPRTRLEYIKEGAFSAFDENYLKDTKTFKGIVIHKENVQTSADFSSRLPFQNNEKFIPVVIESLLRGDKVPVYGKGNNVRDWIYVDDHAQAVWKILTRGKRGETYLVGANNERTNLQIVKSICEILNLNPEESIQFVKDRAGHDFRYAIDASKTKEELKWVPKKSFEAGLKETIKWYTKNQTEE